MKKNPFLEEEPIETAPARLRREFSIQLQIWEMSGHPFGLTTEQTVQVLHGLQDEGWILDDVFLKEAYEHRFCSPFDRALVRARQAEAERELLAERECDVALRKAELEEALRDPKVEFYGPPRLQRSRPQDEAMAVGVAKPTGGTRRGKSAVS